ncbi:MAG: 16S rRNA processing protein RimM [Candidatus Marinimicrobia bacterium]|jgi:16S rRNA processing protein RimM|nr:16S rRNA processing protein RimM [Candidatus Neomarinimicrobiota bacterium]MBT3496237.1 16S rRNA processing protein RimM [Candidatus Neomarinimicrobiota bacterium]MBT3692775.1 16S rRNA processing protein RimM [Candidatus Neomarinimicrobiota bacterium]MBT3732242.1 16S rRNA processing protein RimM [Candidatus Neomarinimicrobiota bacterium]MBT4145239.1 16S rRNA processing protein RimM [Candidatus Neomarinimicrobiota bacterium]
MSRIHPIAKITTTSGLKGEVRLRPLSRYFDEYMNDKSLMIGFSPDTSTDMNIEKTIGIGKKVRFKFEGVNSIDDAERLIGQTIFIEASEFDAINYISSELIGSFVVTDDGEMVGALQDVIWLPNNDVYVIHDGEKERLIPVIPEVVKGVDFEEKMILITPMDGLLD